MEEKKDRLNQAYQYLRGQGIIHTQQDLADKMNATAPNISSALKGVEKVLTDKFLHRFNSAFDNIFSTTWLLYGEGEMLKPTAGTAPGDRAEAAEAGQGNTSLDRMATNVDRLTDKMNRMVTETDKLTDKTDRLMTMMEKLIEQERMNAEANLRNAKANEVNAEAARINADNLRQLIAMLGSAQSGGCEGAEIQQSHLRTAQSVG